MLFRVGFYVRQQVFRNSRVTRSAGSKAIIRAIGSNVMWKGNSGLAPRMIGRARGYARENVSGDSVQNERADVDRFAVKCDATEHVRRQVPSLLANHGSSRMRRPATRHLTLIQSQSKARSGIDQRETSVTEFHETDDDSQPRVPDVLERHHEAVH